jgi:tetratricopeptide (TPR) repeat protein
LENLHHYITNPSKLNRAEADELEILREKYPYFQALHILIAKSHKNQNTFGFNKNLKLASLYAGDRKVLFNFINLEPEPEEINPIVPIVETSEPNKEIIDNSLDILKSLISKIDNSEVNKTEISNEQPEVENEPIIEVAVEEDPLEKLKRLMNQSFVPKNDQTEGPVEEIKDDHETQIVTSSVDSSDSDSLEILSKITPPSILSSSPDNVYPFNWENENKEEKKETEIISNTENLAMLEDIEVEEGLVIEKETEEKAPSDEQDIEIEVSELTNESDIETLELSPEVNEDEKVEIEHLVEVESPTDKIIVSDEILINITENTPNKGLSQNTTANIIEIDKEAKEVEIESKTLETNEHDFYSWLDNFALDEATKLPEKKNEIINSADILEIEDKNESVVEELTIEEPTENKYIELPSDFEEELDDSETEYNPAAWAEIAYDIQAFVKTPEVPEEKEFTVKKVTKEQIDDLLDRFIKKNPSISRTKTEFYKPENMARKSEEFHAEVASESLAQLFYKQGQLHTALEMYEKLLLQNPDKKDIFAARIKSIKEELINRL